MYLRVVSVVPTSQSCVPLNIKKQNFTIWNYSIHNTTRLSVQCTSTWNNLLCPGCLVKKVGASWAPGDGQRGQVPTVKKAGVARVPESRLTCSR